MTTPSPTPLTVSAYEFNLLRIARFLFGAISPEQVSKLVYEAYPGAPPCLGPNCIVLVKDTLSKGIIRTLVRGGGWRSDRFLKAGQPTEGRVWDRVPLDQRRLHFSEHPLRFLMWLSASVPIQGEIDWDAPAEELTPADELFFALALDALRPFQDVFSRLVGRSVFVRNPLCWLFSPGDFAGEKELQPPSFDPLFVAPRATILECLQPALSQRWIRSERTKGLIGDWNRLLRLGRAEQTMFEAFLGSAERAGRTDLARFLLRTLAATLGSGDLAPTFWTGGLQGGGPPRLADRLEAQRAALALPRQIEILVRWDRQARSVGYFDEAYPASQLWKLDWEQARGPELVERARRVLDQLEPLRT